MPYTDKFIATDSLITHLSTIANTIPPFVQADYAGFLSVSAVTVYELAIKDIFNTFASQKDAAFGSFVSKYFKKINGRILLDDLKSQHIKSFGETYLISFNSDIATKQQSTLLARRASIIDSYNNLIISRHGYVHGGSINLTLQEVIDSYNLGKEVIHSLNASMV